MAIDLSVIDRMTQRFEKAPTGKWYARTYDGADVVYEDEVVGYTSGPLPSELSDVYAAQRTAVLLGGRQVVSGVNPVTGGITLKAGDSVITMDGNNIAFIGDSRMRYGRRDWFKTASTADFKGVQVDLLGCDSGVSTDGNGTLEYRASDKAFRWTAPSDTAGPWVIATIGKMKIESGSAAKSLTFINRSISGMPSTDQTVTVLCSGMLYLMQQWTSVVPEVLSKYRYSPTAYYIGAGAATLSQAVEMLPWYESVVSGPGIDVIRIGANDITAYATPDAAAMIDSFISLADARLSQGRKLVICGEPARWDTVSGTPMTAGRLSALIAYNKALYSYALAHNGSCRFVDLYSISRNPAYLDGRPASGMLSDHVHDGVTGVSVFGAAIKTAIDQLGGIHTAPYPMAGDSSVIFNNNSTWLTGTSGTLGTGASGQVPTGVTVARASGSDLTAVSSIYTPSDHQGKMVHVDITSTTAGNILEVSSNLPTSVPTLATMGLSAGDVVEFEVDFEVVSGAPSAVDVFVNLAGSGRRLQISFPEIIGKYHGKSAQITLLASDTTIRQMAYITMPASSTASVRIGEFVTRNVGAF